MKYRIVEDTYADGKTYWKIQWKFLFWWIDGLGDDPYLNPLVFETKEEAVSALRKIKLDELADKRISRKVIE